MPDDALLRAFGFDEEEIVSTAAANGHAYHHKCDGCGKTFGSNRRKVEGRRNWCGECKATGKPGARRARDFRQAHRGQ